MTEELQIKIQNLKNLEYRMDAYNFATGLMYIDGATMAPSQAAGPRGEALSVLAEEGQRMFTADEVGRLLHSLNDVRDELDPQTAREVELLLKDWEKDRRIPLAEYAEYAALLNESDSVWHSAKANNDYDSFAPYLEKVVASAKKMALYQSPDQDPYETMLDDSEEGFTSDVLDGFFTTIREKLVPLIQRVRQSPVSIDDSFLYRHYPVEQQRRFSQYLMDVLRIDKSRCTLAETEHPFTGHMNRWDVRITTHYYENSVANSMYSVIHEGGHALYELGTDEALAHTCLAAGASNGIHEGQSRFYENIIGRSEAFIRLIFPKMREFFPEQLQDVSAHDFYLAVNKVAPSLIRMDADELTYSLHILIRYEIEKLLFHAQISVREVPQLWNRLYKEYLGVDVPDDTHGVLQDSHWSGALFGYFPSYSLGSAYGAQILNSIRKDLSIEDVIASGDLTPLNEWLRAHIFRYGRLLTPKQILRGCCGADFDVRYYIDYLTQKYTEIYRLQEPQR